jgi:4Fe-4S ferredoxin
MPIDETIVGGSRDAAKARRAARHPARPGENCRAPAARFVPIVDRGRCEGKAECVAVCPYDVFEIGRVTDAEFGELGVLSKLKVLAHGRKTARTPRADSCRACGLCVVACPEQAIGLGRTGEE